MAYYATYMPDEFGKLQKVVINAGVGFVLPFYGETAPPGTLACDGSEISRGAYPELFAVLGTKAGAGNGSTTFNLPDFRGQFVRGTGGENNAALGVRQSDAIRNITGRWHIRSGTKKSNVVETVGSLYSVARAGNATNSIVLDDGIEPSPHQYVTFDASRVVPTAPENRPVNIALLWCIIYE